MCCFSIKIKSVTETKIFVRSGSHGHEFIVYSMALDSPADVAMILPIPTPPKSPENAVRFVNLKPYADFFDDMEAGFPVVGEATKGQNEPASGSMSVQPKLLVQQVGSYEASFVPSEQDFRRLDPRFRLPASTWANLPIYHDYGFAVFKLKAGAHTVHPMAFEFPRRDPSRLFFPTVHIHDGKVHQTAEFDHTLYCQKSLADHVNLTSWRESPQTAGQFMKTDRTSGIVRPHDHCYKMPVTGRRKNADIYVNAFTTS